MNLKNILPLLFKNRHLDLWLEKDGKYSKIDRIHIKERANMLIFVNDK